jgi:hypothetical protein
LNVPDVIVAWLKMVKKDITLEFLKKRNLFYRRRVPGRICSLDSFNQSLNQFNWVDIQRQTPNLFTLQVAIISKGQFSKYSK